MCGPVDGIEWKHKDRLGREVSMCGPVSGKRRKSKDRVGEGSTYVRTYVWTSRW